MDAPRRVLSIAAATGRVGYVLLIDRELCDWAMSRVAARSPRAAVEQFGTWFDQLAPDVVITEKPKGSRKGARTRRIIAAIAKAAAQRAVYDIAVPRPRHHRTRYDEAEELAKRFPEIAAWVPKQRRFFEPVSRNTIYFEALALALPVVDGGPGDAQRSSPRG